MRLNSTTVPVCGLIYNDSKVADIMRHGNKFSWRVSRGILSDGHPLPPNGLLFPSLREANIGCLKWIRDNTNVDISKIKSNKNMRNNVKKRIQAPPPVYLTMQQIHLHNAKSKRPVFM